jgi:GTP-binding protein
MIIHDVHYLASYPKEELCPTTNLPEFAFIGRSNVGKSSLINMLCRRKDLAKTSKQPGKTQMINYFEVNESWYLVDLPGYGYAKTAKTTRAKWEKMIHHYLAVRPTLQCAFVLIDSRHELQKKDQEFINWCGANAVPMALVFTKIDKIGLKKAEENISSIRNKLLEEWTDLPQHFLTSAEKEVGREDILNFIEGIVNNF